LVEFQLSVVLPVFNAERFVLKAVSSALIQDEVMEVVVIDDGSNDDSLAICLEVEKNERRVSVYQHHGGKNYGVSASRNLGIKKAKGKFIAFLDADDYYLPDRFKQDIEILQNDPSVDGVYNALGIHVYDETERGLFRKDLTTVKDSIPPDKLFEEMAPIGSSGYFHCDTLTVRRQIFDKVGLFDSTLEIGEDTHMWLKMAARGCLVAGVIDQPVAMRGVHTGNRVKDKAKKFDYYRPLLFLSLLEWAKKNNISVERKRILWDHLYWVYEKSFSGDNQQSLFGKKVKIFLFLVKHGLRNPYLLRHGNYIPSFLRLLK